MTDSPMADKTAVRLAHSLDTFSSTLLVCFNDRPITPATARQRVLELFADAQWPVQTVTKIELWCALADMCHKGLIRPSLLGPNLIVGIAYVVSTGTIQFSLTPLGARTQRARNAISEIIWAKNPKPEPSAQPEN